MRKFRLISSVMSTYQIVFNIALSLFGFGGFVYLTLLSVYKTYFDYDRNMLRTASVFAFCGVLVLYVSGVYPVLMMTTFLWALCVLILCVLLMVVFSFLWQEYGRPYMPQLPIRTQITTLFDFTPRFSCTKFFEITFQNILAYILVVSIHQFTQNTFITIVVFAGTFFVTHMLTIPFFGKWWGIFMVIMAPVGAVVVVVGYLLVPNGVFYVIGFHILMYLAFLMVLRRLALRKL